MQLLLLLCFEFKGIQCILTRTLSRFFHERPSSLDMATMGIERGMVAGNSLTTSIHELATASSTKLFLCGWTCGCAFQFDEVG